MSKPMIARSTNTRIDDVCRHGANAAVYLRSTNVVGVDLPFVV